MWTRLRVGDVDLSTGAVHDGPTQYVMRSRDRMVVDEAGMVDLQTANLLVELAIEQGVGLAFVGDTHQAMPVGHAGAMGSAIRHANAAIELHAVHRFREPDYAALTLRLRDASDRERALVAAGEFAEHGHVDRVDHHDDARERMIDAYVDWHACGNRVTLVSGTNAEADAINDAIQQRRVDQGELDLRRRVGNDAAVHPRRRHRPDPSQRPAHGSRESRAVDRARHPRRLRVSRLCERQRRGGARSTGYASEHLQLAYASTVHGVQGDTADASVAGGPMWMPQGSTLAPRDGGCTMSRSSSRGRMPRPANASPRRCSAALRS